MSSERRCIVDTSVLLYFLLVEKDALLLDLLANPIAVPLAVYDPDDRGLPAEALRHSDLLSEMHQAIRHYEVVARTGGQPPVLLERVQRVHELFDSGHLHVVEMTNEELEVSADLQSRSGVRAYGLKAPLGPGESACVAIAWKRSWTIVTDDEAALVVLDRIHGGKRNYPYERIRKLLIRAGESRHITKETANLLHHQMCDLGFWDRGTPFPPS